MEIASLTRSVVKKNHAIISPDGYINSCIPGWTDCRVHVLISETLGAGFCQMLITFDNSGMLSGITGETEIFFYVLNGKCQAGINNNNKEILVAGQFVYAPAESEYRFENLQEHTQLITFHKRFEKITGYDSPPVFFGDRLKIPGSEFLNDPAVRLQVLLPDHLSHDMAVNILTFEPGAYLPMVETHVMEHGLIFLKGQGIYMLNHEWYPVRKGDSIWMAPYCPQWFAAIGKEPATYLYYKNINRFPE